MIERLKLLVILTALLMLAAGMLSSCAPVFGYADNPADESGVLTSLEPYFSPDKEAHYAGLTTEAERRSFRDVVVINRMRAYEIKFNQFERRLWGDGNGISAGGDLAVLVLGGLGATTGSSATKSALAAASAGIVGAQGAINKDLYYQRTLPALLAQMEANRDRIKLALMNGLKADDASYSLYRADLDLDALQRASGIPEALGNITQQATDNKASAQADLTRAQFTVTEVPAPVQDRKVKINRYVRSLAASGSSVDAAKLDAIAVALNVPKGASVTEERNNILFEMDRLVQTSQDMDALSLKLQPITQQGF